MKIIPKSILVVDDDEQIRELMSRVLVHHRLTVLSSGEAAIKAMEAGNRYDAVITDVDMPGISGIDMLRIAKQNGLLGESSIFVMTGLPDPARVEFCEQIGAVLLVKPFSLKGFAALVGAS